jgi:hypothetical protein
MNFLDDLRAEWIAIRKSLGDHIAYLEAGNRIHPIDQDPNETTAECLERLRKYRSEVEGWLIHLPSQGVMPNVRSPHESLPAPPS